MLSTNNPQCIYFVTEMCTHVHISVTKCCINHCTRTHRIDGDYTLLYQNITCEYEMFLSKLGHYTFECVGSKSSIQNILPLERSSWWRHQMETFSALLAIFKGNSPVTSEFPHKGQWRGALMFSFIFVWKKKFELTIETPVIWDTITPIMTSH